MILGSLFTIVGESLLAPSALKQRSWSTLLVCSVFLTLAFVCVFELFVYKGIVKQFTLDIEELLIWVIGYTT